MVSKFNKWAVLAFFIILCQAAGIVGSFFTLDAIPTWYATLVKPSFSPPSWVFAPVWVTLYTLMGISVFLVWQKRGLSVIKAKIRDRGFWLFWIHLFFNASWSILFFGFQNPLYALIDIAVLWVLLLVTMLHFFRVSTVAGWLLVPYLLWVTFATALNGAIVLLN